MVKYEFNTTDEKGNKVMDQMTKEETIQAMKDIRAQYGDNVIIEFSGDGMAALVENRKGQVDEMITDEQRAAKAERDAAFMNEIIQNEHIEVAPEHMQGVTDYNRIMHEKSPEIAAKVDSYMSEFSKTNDTTYLQKAAKLSFDWYKENYMKHADWFEAPKSGNAAAASVSVESQPKLSGKAQKLLDELSAKYSNINFMVGNGDPSSMKELMQSSGKEYSVILTVEELEKMASDDAYKEEVLDRTGRSIDFSNRINARFGFVSINSSAAGGIASRYGFALNNDGTMELFAELLNRAHEKKALIQSVSMDGMLNQIEHLDWSQISLENKIVFKED